MSRLWLLGPLLFSVSLAADASAAELQLTWQAPAECPDAATARRAVSELAPEAETSTPVSVYIRQENTTWTAEVVTVDGRRVVRGSSCADVATAAEAIVALVAGPSKPQASFTDTSAGATEQTPPSAAAPPQAPAAQPDIVSKQEPPRAALVSAVPTPGPLPPDRANDAKALDSERAIHWGALARFVSDMGVLPAISFGASAGVRLRARAVFAELSVSALLPRDVQLTRMPARGGSIGFQTAGLRACAAPFARLMVFACLGMEGGRITGSGTGVDHATPVQALWLAPSGQVSVQLAGGSDFKLEADLALNVPLLRPELGLTAVDPAYRPSAVSVRAGAGIGWR